MDIIDRQKVRTDEDYRFLLSCQKIIADNKAKSERQLSLKLSAGKNPALINKIKEGIQSAQKENIDILTTFYSIRKEYIYVGSEPIYSEIENKNEQENIKEENKRLVEENKRFREELDHVRKALDKAKDEIIELLKKYNQL